MKKYLIYLLFAGILSSCNDFLDQKPKTQTDAEDMFKTEQGFKDALIACYGKMASNTLYGKALTMTTLEFMAQHWNFSTFNNPIASELKGLDFTKSSSKSTFSEIYGSLYNVIVQANDVLTHLEKNSAEFDSDAVRGIIEAEALTVRAFIHFDVLRLFGQMPSGNGKKVSLGYATTVGNQDIAFVSFEEYTRLLFNDLNRAELLFKQYDPLTKYTLAEMDNSSVVSENFLTYRRFRFNLYALKALKARIYLYLGNKTEAYKSALEVITANANSGSVVTLSGDNDLKNQFYGMPTESIFVLSKSNISNSWFNVDQLYLDQSVFQQLFADRQSMDSRALIVWNRTSQTSTGTVRPTLRKYLQPESTETITSFNKEVRRQIVPLIRLAEMYLIAIETTTSSVEANSLYKTFMRSRRIDITSDIPDFKTQLEAEYRCEFFAEGQMFFWYKRHASERMQWQTGTNKLTESNYIIPLPESELKQN